MISDAISRREMPRRPRHMLSSYAIKLLASHAKKIHATSINSKPATALRQEFSTVMTLITLRHAMTRLFGLEREKAKLS